MSIELKGILTGVLLLFSIGFGIWLSRKGRPLSAGILSLHKLTALGVIVFTVLAAVSLFKSADLPSAVRPLVIAFGVAVVALFVTGAALSIRKELNARVRTVHTILTALAAISGAAAACVMLLMQ